MAAATAQQLRAQAAEFDAQAAESRKRCGADGMLSQWASGISASLRRTEAAIVERGGVWDFPALFDLDGHLVPARLEYKKDRFGRTRDAWRLMDAHGRGIGWFNPSQAEDKNRRRTNNAKKGIYIGRVLAPAKADTTGNHPTVVRVIPVRTDGGWDPNVEVLDNGQRDERAEIVAAYQAAWQARDHKVIAEMENAAYDGGYVDELIAARKATA